MIAELYEVRGRRARWWFGLQPRAEGALPAATLGGWPVLDAR